MYTLILNGSPRPRGDTNALVQAFCREINGVVEQIDGYRVDLSPCVDCRRCAEGGGCVIEDGMGEIYEKVRRAQVVVLASPLYFSTLTGPLLSLCSRFQSLYMARRSGKTSSMGDKAGLVLLTGGGSTKDPSGAFRTARIILREMGAGEIRQVASIGTDRLPAARDEEALRQVRDAAWAYNRMFAEPMQEKQVRR